MNNLLKNLMGTLLDVHTSEGEDMGLVSRCAQGFSYRDRMVLTSDYCSILSRLIEPHSRRECVSLTRRVRITF
jgi:hypothetical protein